MATTQQTGHSPTGTALARALKQVTRRLRWRRVLRYASRGVLTAVVLSLLAVGFAHCDLLPDWLPLELVVPVLLLLGLGAGIGSAYAHPFELMAAARMAESRLGLKERLSSALEFERSNVTPRDPEAALLVRLQREDAATHAQSLQAADAVPLSPLPWEARVLVPALILLVLALLLPTLPIFTPPAVRTERAVVQKSGQNLSTGARRIEKEADAQALPATKRAVQKMQVLSRKMQTGRMNKKQAMVLMSRLRQQIATDQKRVAQSGSDSGQTAKPLDQAGRELAQSSVLPKGKPGSQTGTTPEVQQAGQAMQRNDASGMSDSLRRMAQRTQAGQMSPAQQKQAAQALQRLSNALKGTSQSEAQRHVQAAADALQHGDQARAADEMRRAADAAQHENQRQQDAQGLQQAQQTLQNNQQQIAQAQKPGDVPRDSPNGNSSQSGQPSPQAGPFDKSHQGTGQTPGQNKGQTAGQNGRGGASTSGGSPSNEGQGRGKSAPNTPGPGQRAASSGQGQTTPGQNTGIVRGAVHPLDPKFDSAKNPKYGKVYLGAGTNDAGTHQKAQPGAKSQSGPPTASVVPYTGYVAPARKSAEATMDKEDVPPSYRSSVRRYFDAIQPSGKP